jgi:hypothetical protein
MLSFFLEIMSATYCLSLAVLLNESFIGIANALALVGFGRTEPAKLSGHAQQLHVVGLDHGMRAPFT